MVPPKAACAWAAAGPRNFVGGGAGALFSPKRGAQGIPRAVHWPYTTPETSNKDLWQARQITEWPINNTSRCSPLGGIYSHN